MFSKPSSDIRLYERVRLQSFQGLINSTSQNKTRPSGRYSNVLLEELVKAEVISLQLLLAIEDVAKFVKQNFNSGNVLRQAKRSQCDQTDGQDNDSLRCFQSALAQSAGALEELTKLQISDNLAGENMEIPQDTNCGVFNHSLSTPISCAGDQNPAPNCAVNKRLSYGSEGTTTSPSEPSWDFSVRVSDLSTTPSDATDLQDSLLSCREAMDSEGKDNGLNIGSIARDAVKTLRNEMEELQKKHEKQFMTYVGKYLDLNQDENQNTRNLLEKIMENLSPQDQNWTYHGVFDEHGMEQLFYFVLLQKTLKSCLAVIDTVNMEDRENLEKKVQPRKNQGNQINPVVNSSLSSLHSSHNIDQTGQCSSLVLNQTDSSSSNGADGFQQSCLRENSTTHTAQGVTQNQRVRVSNCAETKELEHSLANNGLSHANRKRMNEFEAEQETKKQRKNKNIFACFNAKWQKRRQKKLRKGRE